MRARPLPRVLGAALALGIGLLACRAPDPRAELEISDLETHWAVDPPQSGTQYLAPVVRFHLKNRGGGVLRSVQANAVFRRKGEIENWGSAWLQVTTRGHSLAPGQETLVVMKSDGRYSSNGPVEGMLKHADFKDASVQVFVRVGSSPWTKLGEADVDRRVGAKSVQAGG